MKALYRCFDEAGSLLYVGQSLVVQKRLDLHSNASEWFSRVRSITVEPYEDGNELLIAEKLAIRAEKPALNQHHAGRKVMQIGHYVFTPHLVFDFAAHVLKTRSEEELAERLGTSVDELSKTRVLRYLATEFEIATVSKATGYDDWVIRQIAKNACRKSGVVDLDVWQVFESEGFAPFGLFEPESHSKWSGRTLGGKYGIFRNTNINRKEK